jgi:cyanophycinase-like exopeptidase
MLPVIDLRTNAVGARVCHPNILRLLHLAHRRDCAFCGPTEPLHREDVVPKWLAGELRENSDELRARAANARGVLSRPEASTTVGRRFVELAGGPSAKIVLIPSAAGDKAARDPALLEFFRARLGAACCTILHTNDRSTAVAFLRGTVIMPHLNRGHARELLVAEIQRSGGLIGLGISENTAAVITGDRLDVVGDGDVLVVDGTSHVLRAGDRFNLKPRQ